MSKHKKNNIKVRRSWGDLDPSTKVHKDESKYNRADAKKEALAELDADLFDDEDQDDLQY